jgi:predicted transposase YdaD
VPSNTPIITELQDAEENVELAVLSAMVHARSTDIQLVSRITSTAIVASAHIDDERSKLYFDLLSTSLLRSAPKAREATMNSFGYEYQSEFARRYVAEGKAEGRMEGRVELALKLLASRFGRLSDEAQTRVRSAQDGQLDTVLERMLTAQTLEEALGPP